MPLQSSAESMLARRTFAARLACSRRDNTSTCVSTFSRHYFRSETRHLKGNERTSLILCSWAAEDDGINATPAQTLLGWYGVRASPSPCRECRSIITVQPHAKRVKPSVMEELMMVVCAVMQIADESNGSGTRCIGSAAKLPAPCSTLCWCVRPVVAERQAKRVRRSKMEELIMVVWDITQIAGDSHFPVSASCFFRV
jgi:hypothetical protein